MKWPYRTCKPFTKFSKPNPKKCVLLTREVEFLGHIVTGEGVGTDLAKVAAIRQWPMQSNAREVRSFL